MYSVREDSTDCCCMPMAGMTIGASHHVPLRPSYVHPSTCMKFHTFTLTGGGADNCFCYNTCPPIYDETNAFPIYTSNTVSSPSCLLFAR